jgi:ribose 5-phosphate isomerase B
MKENIIIIASDHAGFKLKSIISKHLKDQNYIVEDTGCFTEDPVDYPDYAKKLCLNIKNKKGILICGSGIGMSICANRFPNVRAALCLTEEMSTLARQHNNANILILGARMVTSQIALKCVNSFLSTKFLAGRHQARIDKLIT